MLAYLPLIQKLILDYVTRKPHEGFSFNFQGLGLMALSGLLGLISLFFLLLALQTYLESLYGEPVSWLGTAAISLVMTGIVFACASASIRKKAFVHRVKEDVQDHLSPVTSILEELAEPIKDHPIAAVVLAGLAGLLAGDKISGNGTE